MITGGLPDWGSAPSARLTDATGDPVINGRRGCGVTERRGLEPRTHPVLRVDTFGVPYGLSISVEIVFPDLLHESS